MIRRVQVGIVNIVIFFLLNLQGLNEICYLPRKDEKFLTEKICQYESL